MSTQYDHTLKALQQGANRHGRRLVVAGLLVMLLFLLVWQASEQGTIRDREFNRLSTQSGIIYHDLRRQLMSIRASHTNLQAELLSGAKTFESVRPDIEKRLSAFVQTINGVRTVTLLDAKASVLASSNPQQQKGNSLEDNELVLRVMQGAQPGILYISRPYPLAENMLTIAVASMLMDERGEFSGMMVTELSPLETGILLSSVVYAEDMHAGIVHADGTVFLAEPVMQKLLGHNLADPQSAFTEHVHSGNELSLYHGKQLYSDDRRLIVQQTIMPAELNISDALIVRISRNHDAVFAKLHRSRWFMAGLYLALVVSSVVFLRLWQRKSRQAFTNLSNTQKQLVASNGMLARLNRQLEQ